MGRLELPLPDLGGSLDAQAKDMQERIRGHVPEQFRKSIIVKPFRKGQSTGLSIDYDDRAENYVYTAMEYPRSGGKK